MSIAKDISTITTIPLTEVKTVIETMVDCICYDLQEHIRNQEDHIDIDIGIGLLVLNIDNENIEYKFIPSASLENDIIYTLQNDCCPLIVKAENSLCNKVVGAYKEFF